MSVLFDDYPRGQAAYDEMVGPDGVRPALRSVAAELDRLGLDEVRSRAEYLSSVYIDQGVTFDIGGEERPFPLDIVPRVMQADEFRATWVANKAVYRTRMAIADGGELLVIAPGVERFGEQPEVDALIRKYGYISQDEAVRLYQDQADMQDIPHGTAHLPHGSSEGRFTITYAPGHLTREEIEGVGYEYMDVEEALRRYDPAVMKDGWNTMPDGERVFFISTPSAGLWSTREKLEQRATHERHA